MNEQNAQNNSAREHMLNSQIYTNKVDNDFVLAAIESIPREEFVPPKLRGVAYVDEDLNLGEGRYLMEPMVFARLLQLAEIKGTEKVLVVASATGYEVAVISVLAKQVVGLENNINFISAAQANLKSLNILNAAFVKAELDKGAERHKPFDLIFINGAVETIPPKLYAQLCNGGRIVALKTDSGMTGPYHATVIHKHDNVISESWEFQAFAPKLKEFILKPGFKF